MPSKLKVTLRRSGIGRPRTQKDTLRGMGLTRLHKTVILPNTPDFRGMVKKVIHLVEVEEVDAADPARPARAAEPALAPPPAAPAQGGEPS